jgi:hypothetical protein
MKLFVNKILNQDLGGKLSKTLALIFTTTLVLSLSSCEKSRFFNDRSKNKPVITVDEPSNPAPVDETPVVTPTNVKIYPGAEGFGTNTRAAYGGGVVPKILTVTNLNASGPGSFADAVNQTYPRIIVFEVSGVITMPDFLDINYPYVSIYGQTAPYPGITIRGYGLAVQTHDVLVQGIKVRPGNITGRTPDGISLGPYNGKPVYNVVIDHCSVSWALDENVGINSCGEGITISNCLISEGLNPNGHGFGLLAMDVKQVSVIKNLFVHCTDRTPLINGATQQAFVANNAIYNSDTHSIYFGEPEGGTTPINGAAIANYYIPGAKNRNDYIISLHSQLLSSSKIFLEDNRTYGKSATDAWSTSLVHNPANLPVKTLTMPFTAPDYKRLTAADALTYTLANAGAFPRNRDAIDARVVEEVKNRTGKRIIDPSEVGGWVFESRTHKLTLPADPHGDENKDGYTNMEEFVFKLL